jgi:hypothetical protein
MLLHDLQESLRGILQKDIKFILNKKILREGKLILFNVKDFYIHFLLETQKKPFTKNYEIPVPFDIIQAQGSLTFDYSTQHIIKNNKQISLLIDSAVKKTNKTSKFYNNILTIEF